jgi:hypothetical protein
MLRIRQHGLGRAFFHHDIGESAIGSGAEKLRRLGRRLVTRR